MPSRDLFYARCTMFEPLASPRYDTSSRQAAFAGALLLLAAVASGSVSSHSGTMLNTVARVDRLHRLVSESAVFPLPPIVLAGDHGTLCLLR